MSNNQTISVRDDSRYFTYIYKKLGDYARSYVMHRVSNAIQAYTVNSDGITTHVGIYTTKGIEVTVKGNFCKEQYPIALISELIRCTSRRSEEEYLDNLNTYAWVSAMDKILASKGKEDWGLSWLKSLSNHYPLVPDEPESSHTEPVALG